MKCVEHNRANKLTNRLDLDKHSCYIHVRESSMSGKHVVKEPLMT